MKLLTQKKYLITIALLCVIITTFIWTRNNTQSWTYESEKNISIQLSADIQSRIKTLALFIGYARSGHTLIGSLLDAHPHIIISNELYIFQRWKEWKNESKTRENLINKMYENSYRQSFGNGYRSATKRVGRTYAVPNQWQGKYQDYIKVIGDKKGGATTKFLSKKLKSAKEVLDTINIETKFVHMVRNPYDNIATMVLRELKIKTSDAHAAKNKVNNTAALKHCMNSYLWTVKLNHDLINVYGSRILTLHSEDVIVNPRAILKQLCEFLNVSCTQDYLDDCASIIYKSTSKTRRTIVWPPSLKQMVEEAIQTYPFLRRYTFE